MDEERLQNAMQIILHAGDARNLAMKALTALNDFDIVTAKEDLKEAQAELLKSHEIHTAVITEEARGETPEYSVLFAHAQDTMMTISSEINIAEHLIQLTEALDERFKKLENR